MVILLQMDDDQNDDWWWQRSTSHNDVDHHDKLVTLQSGNETKRAGAFGGHEGQRTAVLSRAANWGLYAPMQFSIAP